MELHNRLAQSALSLPPSGIRKFFDIVSQMPDTISLGVGEPDFVTPWRVIESGVYSLEQGHTHYTSNFGLLELRRNISQYLEDIFKVDYNPESEIIVTMGVSEALDISLRAVVNPGDEVIIPEPAYVSYRPNVQMLHAVPVAVETTMEEQFELRADRLSQKITDKTKAILLNSPNNPTGAVIPKQELQKIGQIAKEKGIFIITDDIYSELVYSTDPYTVASKEGVKENVILLNGFSKTYAMTGWRIGYVCAHPSVIEVIMKIHQYTALCAPVTGQTAAIEALKNGKGDKERMRSEYLRRRNFVTERFNEIGLSCNTPGGAFYVFPEIKNTGLSPGEFAERLLYEHKVAVVPGDVFGAQDFQNIRCSYATSMEKLQKAMERIDNFVQSL